MSYGRMLVAFVGFIAVLLDSVVVAEFAGHWLRRLLHCRQFPVGQRYGLDETELLSLRGCSTALFCKSDSRLAG
jgi:hypothetical protein